MSRATKQLLVELSTHLLNTCNHHLEISDVYFEGKGRISVRLPKHAELVFDLWIRITEWPGVGLPGTWFCLSRRDVVLARIRTDDENAFSKVVQFVDRACKFKPIDVVRMNALNEVETVFSGPAKNLMIHFQNCDPKYGLADAERLVEIQKARVEHQPSEVKDQCWASHADHMLFFAD